LSGKIGCAVVVAVGPGVDGALVERSVSSVVAGLAGVPGGLVVVCGDGPGVSEGMLRGVVEGVSGGSVPVEVWSSAVSLGRYGVDRVVCEMLGGRIAA
jgi:hypothetical protein